MVKHFLFILLQCATVTLAQQLPQKTYTYIFKFSTPISQTENQVLGLFFNDEYLDFKTYVLEIKADTLYKITSTQPHKVFAYGYHMQPYSYIIHANDTILIGFKNNVPFFRSAKNDPFVKISKVLQQRAEGLEPERQIVSYKRAPSYQKLIIGNLNNRIGILDSLNKETILTKEGYKIFNSEIYSLYYLDAMRPFYGKDKLDINSLSLDYQKDLKAIKEFVNSKDIDQTSSMFKLVAWNYFKFYLMNGRYKQSLSQGLDMIKQNYTGTLQDFITFKYLKDNYAVFRTSEKHFITSYKTNTLSKEYRDYLDAEENKYKNVLQDSIGSVALHTSDNKTITLKSLIVENAGKLLYIDFWASWCAPCIGEIPYALSHIQKEDTLSTKMKYIFISIDKNKKDWLKAVEEYKLSSIQSNYIIDGNSETFLKKELSLNSIPRYIIISSAGFITGYDVFRPSDKDFESKISEFLTSSK